MAKCEMCGKESNLFKTTIEGTILNVCKQCSKYGKVLDTPNYQRKRKKRFYNKEPEKETIKIIIPEFWKIIKQKRESLDLKQEQLAKKIAEKESVIHHLESGNHKPSIKLAEKLERHLNIKLIEEYEEEHLDNQSNESQNFTLGDFIKKRKKKD